MLTLPREIWIEKDRLIQQPVEELKQLRANERSIGRAYSAKLKNVSLLLEGNTEGAFSIEIGNKDGNCLILSADGEEYCLDRSGMTEVYAEKFGTIRYAKQVREETDCPGYRSFQYRDFLRSWENGIYFENVYRSCFLCKGEKSERKVL